MDGEAHRQGHRQDEGGGEDEGARGVGRVVEAVRGQEPRVVVEADVEAHEGERRGGRPGGEWPALQAGQGDEGERLAHDRRAAAGSSRARASTSSW